MLYAPLTSPMRATYPTHLILLALITLGGNANGNKKLKPLLVYRSENPQALKNITKSSLPVIWKVT
jgi:hypothetical protein